MQSTRSGKADLLLLVGSDRDDQITVSGNRARSAGSSDFHQLIEPNRPRHLLHITPNMFRQRVRPDLSPYSCLINLITEAEHNQRVLDNLRKLLRGVRAKVINRPEAVLATTRDQVARRMTGVPGLLAPKAIRLRSAKPRIVGEAIEKAGLRFPIILRPIGTHTGQIVGLFDDLDRMVAGMSEGTSYIATEFIDFRSDDGLYRKYRVFFIGPHMIFRHLQVLDHWNVHGREGRAFMLARPELLKEEIDLYATPEGAFPEEVKRTLAAIRERMDLDYFGIDFAKAPDGRVLLFEANATMSLYATLLGPEFDHHQRCLPPARAAFRELIGPAA